MRERLRAPRWNQGFTLLEIMVAIVIAAVLLLVGVPQIKRFQSNSKLRSRVDTLVADLQLARSTATQQAVRLPPTTHVAASHFSNATTGAGSFPSPYRVFKISSRGQEGDDVRSDSIEPEFAVTVTGTTASSGDFNDLRSVTAFAINPSSAPTDQVVTFNANGTLNQPMTLRLSNQVQQFRIDVSKLGDVKVTPETPGTGS